MTKTINECCINFENYLNELHQKDGILEAKTYILINLIITINIINLI
jgi:hypothetical protein